MLFALPGSIDSPISYQHWLLQKPLAALSLVGQVAPPSTDFQTTPFTPVHTGPVAGSSVAARAVTVEPTLLIASLMLTMPVSVSTLVKTGAVPGAFVAVAVRYTPVVPSPPWSL